MTPFARELSLNKRRQHKNDSTNIDRIFTDQEELLYYQRHAATPKISHTRSVDCTHPHEAYLKNVGNPKNWDQLEKVFALEHIPSEDLRFETVK